MKDLLLPIIGAVLFISVVGYFSNNIAKNGVPSLAPQDQKKVNISIDDTVVDAEVVDTPATREKGLSGKASLCESCGMLFDFNTAQNKYPSFWMKDMLFLIDIIWINHEKEIVQIDKAVEPPPSGTKDSNLKLYQSPEPIEYVLEVNAGFTDQNGVEVGDTANF